MHAVRNVGTVPARYAVLMIGGDTKSRPRIGAEIADF